MNFIGFLKFIFTAGFMKTLDEISIRWYPANLHLSWKISSIWEGPNLKTHDCNSNGIPSNLIKVIAFLEKHRSEEQKLLDTLVKIEYPNVNVNSSKSGRLSLTDSQKDYL